MLLAESLLGSSSAAPVYIEDVFSTYLYTGNGTSQTINNGIDLSTKGGMVWAKSRSIGLENILFDTVRGATKYLLTPGTGGQATDAQSLTSFNTNGFSVGTNSYVNSSAGSALFTSWTFRKQPKFFDVVTYTGTGSARTVAHNLGSTPGVIICKKTSNTSDWVMYHRSVGATAALKLNQTYASDVDASYWNNTAPTDSVFTVKSDDATNANGATYVAYLFAHDAGGFGATGTDNVISCGSYNGTGSSTVSVTLGFEPQWVLIKKATGSTFTDGSASWCVFDNMRGIPTGGSDACLYANLSDAENNQGTGNFINVTATGFEVPPTGNLTNQSACSYIYIAIRRGPMKTPTTGTGVFSPIASSATTGTKLTTNFPVDLQMFALRTSGQVQAYDRLRGVSSTTTESGQRLITSSTAAESTVTATVRAWDNTGFQMPSYWTGSSMVFWNFGRAPGFFDVVCYTGTAISGSSGGFSHNLGVVPELIIIKNRGAAYDWKVKLVSVLGRKDMSLNSNAAAPVVSSTYWDNLTDTSAKFYTRADNNEVDAVGSNYVAYLFATVAGVSKVGSYTGTGTTNQINCGFTGGARFVLIKRTDSTGDWYVWDTARGIVAGNDPYLLLNSTAAEVTSTDYVDTYSAGFELSSTAPAALNANGGSYIFLAIA